jgi:hypothetical protein
MNTIKFTAIISTVLALSSCTAQKLHFAEFTDPSTLSINLEETSLKNVSNVGAVSGGNYKDSGEMSSYYWHAFAFGQFEGFVPLPFDNPNQVTKAWFEESLSSNFGKSGTETVDIYVKTLQIKSQRDASYNYRACLVELNLTIKKENGTVESFTVNGTAKLKGAGIQVSGVRTSLSALGVRFTPDSPQVCKLAIQNGLKKLVK